MLKWNARPLGLLCFGMTTNMLMFVLTGWTSPEFIKIVICYAIFYGGAGQFIAGILEILNNNTFGGTAFCSYGCFWMGWYLIETGVNKQDIPSSGNALWCGLWAILTLGFYIITLRKNICLQLVFLNLIVTFSLLAAGEYNKNCKIAAGYFGFFSGSSAIYSAFGILYKDELEYDIPGLKEIKYI
jgi:succinate-acetate transporter protein